RASSTANSSRSGRGPATAHSKGISMRKIIIASMAAAAFSLAACSEKAQDETAEAGAAVADDAAAAGDAVAEGAADAADATADAAKDAGAAVEGAAKDAG